LAFFIWLEGTAFSVWIRESPSLWGFPFILYLHTLGLAMLAGLSSAVALGLLGSPAMRPSRTWLGLFRIMWLGLAVNALSGLALLIAYPAKALTNPVFYVKLTAIAIAVGIVLRLERVFAAADSGAGAGAGSGARLRLAAGTLLVLWAVAILAGRLLAYTHSILMARETLFF
jgi:hypothetical protein